MNRKLWLETRPFFFVALFLSCGLTVLYSGVFGPSLIFVYDEPVGFVIHIGAGYDTAYVEQNLPPGYYYRGFEAMTRILWPVIALVLCTGGIFSERRGGTASFNLSLPLSRAGWLWRKIAMVSFLTLACAFLTSLLALGFGLWLALDRSLVWLLTHPVLITLPALPWIGVCLYVQSWTSGFVKNSVSAVIVPFFVTGVGMALYIPLVLARPVAAPMVIAMGTLAVGAGCMFLATRRFERLDF